MLAPIHGYYTVAFMTPPAVCPCCSAFHGRDHQLLPRLHGSVWAKPVPNTNRSNWTIFRDRLRHTVCNILGSAPLALPEGAAPAAPSRRR